MVTRQDTFASQLTLKGCAKPQSGIQITSIKIYSIYASTKNIRTYEYVIYLLNVESIEILRKKSRIFLVAGKVNLRHVRLRLDAVIKMKRSEVSIDLKFNICQCREAAPPEVNPTSIVLTETVPLLCLPDFENRGLFWAPCFKNDSDRPEWIRKKTPR